MSSEGREQAFLEPRFLLDGSLGKLAKYLRMFGLDAELLDRPLSQLLRKALQEGRWVLTRKAEARKRNSWPVPVVHLREDRPEAQLIRVLKSLVSPVNRAGWFWRCLVCNTPLTEVSRQEACFMVPEYVGLSQESFRHCPGCGRIYWPGTHRQNMLRNMERWAMEAWGVIPQT